MAKKAQVTKHKAYMVLTPFPWRGHWTTNKQTLELLDCEAAALLITGKIQLITKQITDGSK